MPTSLDENFTIFDDFVTPKRTKKALDQINIFRKKMMTFLPIYLDEKATILIDFCLENKKSVDNIFMRNNQVFGTLEEVKDNHFDGFIVEGSFTSFDDFSD